MPISLAQLRQMHAIDKLIIHSLDQSLYQASVEINGSETIVEIKNGALLKAKNLKEMKDIFADFPVREATLRQTSAYDEMINQTPKYGTNQMEVPINIRGDF